MTIQQQAERVFAAHLKDNPYPGRGLAVGRSQRGDGWIIVYFIMGRSDNSRNRRFATDGERLYTEPVDLSKVTDPTLIIYDAMLSLPGIQIVSNGDQTRTVHSALQCGGTFEGALATREREPDSPNFTPRITAMLDVRSAGDNLAFSILKANPADPALTDRYTVRPASPPPGLAYGLTTYLGDGDPLPSFTGDLLTLPVAGSPQAILDGYWEALDQNNRVSLAVKAIAADGTASELLVRNRHA
jgi:IMP cyclohydrolase